MSYEAMKRINRAQRREMDRQVSKSIQLIQRELNFLNQHGDPKYRLIKQSSLRYKAVRVIQKIFEGE